jgi:hypothetical protein
VLYGILGIIYWEVLLIVGHTPDALLKAMPITAAAAFLLLLAHWLKTMRHHHPTGKS